MANHRYRVNIDILSMFLSLALDRGLTKEMDRILCKEIFKVQIMCGLDGVLRKY